MKPWHTLKYKACRYKSHSLLFLCLTLISCDLFTSKEYTKEQLVNEEMQHINRNNLDQYPLFETCDETAKRSSQKACFETTFTNHLKTVLQQHELVVHEHIHDTVWIHFRIDSLGVITVSDIEKDKETAVQLPQLDRIFRSAIKALPKLYPPLKRDIPVAAKFKIPVVLQVE